MADEQMNGVTIGAREIYEAVVRLTTTVERLTAQHDDVQRDLMDHEVRLRALDAVPGFVTDHETRLRVLERGRWPLPAVTALLAIASVVVAIVALYH